MKYQPETLLQEFEKSLKNNLPSIDSFHKDYQEALVEMLFAGGKRFRPMLLLSVVNARNPLLISGAMNVALALEYLHTYSLIHDDLPAMDDSPLRRGKPTLHITYDEVMAILVGDALNTHAFELISDAPLSSDVRINCVSSLSKAGGSNGMVLGQAIDCHFENKPLTLEQVEFMHLHKTAKLIAASLQMGGIISGLSNEELERLYNFGLRLGLLFQVQDDILDAVSDSEAEGKPVSNDGDKNSFINFMGLEETISYSHKLVDELETTLSSFEQNIQDALNGMLKSYFDRNR